MILCIGTTPAAQRVMLFERLALDSVNRAKMTLDGAAGKSINVAKVLSQLGEQVAATGFLGGDRGERIAQALRQQGIQIHFIMVATPTRECVTVIDENTGTHTELVEESPSVTSAEYSALWQVLPSLLAKARAVVMSGTICPGVAPDFYARCVTLAKTKTTLTVVDGSGDVLTNALAARPDLVKPNRAELARTLQRELPDEPSLLSGIHELHRRGASRIVVTAGASPTIAFDGQRFWRIFSPRVKALNPIGSGDAFTAALTASLLRGDDLAEACRQGSAAGAANALTWMAGEVSREIVHTIAAEVVVESIVSRA